MSQEIYGIDKEHGHPKATQLIPEEFFWDCTDDIAPFGSDEGDTALAEFRGWRKKNPDVPVIECMIWTIEGVGEMEFSEYNESLLDPEKMRSQMEDKNFDSRQFIYTLDVSVIATGFGQLADEGKIDEEIKPVIRIALERQIIWAGLLTDWEYAPQYISNLKVLQRALEAA